MDNNFEYNRYTLNTDKMGKTTFYPYNMYHKIVVFNNIFTLKMYLMIIWIQIQGQVPYFMQLNWLQVSLADLRINKAFTTLGKWLYIWHLE